ncbi:hypothetical protein RISK_002567 [Rhodopirellula islandica]|uniref:Uncharacterized protein n=1 Tax=Rhodopirellula islandica TaxID=595434 RepID=A0A0J1BFM0_RHOIS|nr:hypothetical protein RISK_002567 [Rhodopirellula islandica]
MRVPVEEDWREFVLSACVSSLEFGCRWLVIEFHGKLHGRVSS